VLHAPRLLLGRFRGFVGHDFAVSVNDLLGLSAADLLLAWPDGSSKDRVNQGRVLVKQQKPDGDRIVEWRMRNEEKKQKSSEYAATYSTIRNVGFRRNY
jgi:hypothetical protein